MIIIIIFEREDFIKIESNTKFAKIRIANLKPVHFYCRDAVYFI